MPSPEDAGLLQGLQEAVDATCTEAERKWGVGRVEQLAGLADPNLLARFRRQQESWRAALLAAWEAEPLSATQLAVAQAKAASMQRAWRALDAHAEEAGQRPVAPWVWEARLADGRVLALVQTSAEASRVIAEGRHVTVMTAEDVAGVVDALDRMTRDGQRASRTAAKARRKAVENTLGAAPFDAAQGDEIPFGDSPLADPQLAVIDDDFPSLSTIGKG